MRAIYPPLILRTFPPKANCLLFSSVQTLLKKPQTKRNVSGHSESTSGCESARSSEMGDDGSLDTSFNQAHSGNDGSSERAGHTNDISAESALSDEMLDMVRRAQENQRSPYTKFEVAPQLAESGPMPHHPNVMPVGYSRVGTTDNHGFVPGHESPDQRQHNLHNIPSAINRVAPATGGYVAFDQAKSGTPSAPELLPPSSQESAQPVGGYITVAKASQMASAASTPMAEGGNEAFAPPSNPMAYSKVGIERLPAASNNSGYTHPSLLMGNGGQNLHSSNQQNPHRPEPQLLPALPLSENYSKVRYNHRFSQHQLTLSTPVCSLSPGRDRFHGRLGLRPTPERCCPQQQGRPRLPALWPHPLGVANRRGKWGLRTYVARGSAQGAAGGGQVALLQTCHESQRHKVQYGVDGIVTG